MWLFSTTQTKVKILTTNDLTETTRYDKIGVGIKPIQNEKGLTKMLTVTETKEITLLDFEAWSGGADRLKTIEGLGIDEEAEQYIIDNLGESVEDITLNDFLWFDMDDFIEEHEQRIKEEMEAEDDE